MEAHGEGTPLGARLKELRLERALTQVEVSAKAGLALDAVSKIETGRRRPRPGTVRKLAAALGVEVPALTREPGEAAASAGTTAETPPATAGEVAAVELAVAEVFGEMEAHAEQRAAAEGISKDESLVRMVRERSRRLPKPRLRPREEMPKIAAGGLTAAAAVSADRA